jgi:hypothetical protein
MRCLLDFWKISANLSYSKEVSQPQADEMNIYMVQNVVPFITASSLQPQIMTNTEMDVLLTLFYIQTCKTVS